MSGRQYTLPMGISDSPLRDRVIFVEGVARSGTSWLVALLCLHPSIAGVGEESHLFDLGVDRLFENYERSTGRFLRGFVSRPELVDLVRDLCDGVLMRMRDSTDPGAEFVVEKTPAPLDTQQLTSRKLECFPDAWFVHIVRNGEEVARSLVRMPWMEGRSESQCYEVWQRRCEGLRSALSQSERYREVAYEELKEDPEGTVSELLRWMGIEASSEYLDAVRDASRVSYDGWAQTKAGGAQDRSKGGRMKERVRSRAMARSPKPNDAQSANEPTITVLERLVEALRDADEERLRACTADSLSVVFHSAKEQCTASGDEAIRVLQRVGRGIFRPRLLSEQWTAAAGTWLAEDSPPAITALFSGSRGNGSRVQLFVALALEGTLIRSATVIAPGELGVGATVAPE